MSDFQKAANCACGLTGRVRRLEDEMKRYSNALGEERAENTRLRELNQASLDKVSGMMAVLALAKEWQCIQPQRYIEILELGEILSTVQKPLAVVDGGVFGGQLDHLKNWPWNDGFFRVYPSVVIPKPLDEGTTALTPVTVIVIPKEASHGI